MIAIANRDQRGEDARSAEPSPAVLPFRTARPRRRCAEPTCAATFRAYKGDARFCGRACAARFHDRKKKRALELYDIAYAWRKNRKLLTDMAQIVRRWHEEDARLRARADRETER